MTISKERESASPPASLRRRVAALPARVHAEVTDWRRSGLLRRVILGLLVGAVGGLIFHWMQAPLAFMMGSLTATMIASLAGAPIASTFKLRATFILFVGLFLGQSFQSDGAARILDWPLSIALAILYVPVAGWVAYVVFRHFARSDGRTAFFAAMPGGLSGVILIAEELGADERRVTLAQSLRLALVVMTAPTLFFGVVAHGVAASDATIVNAAPLISFGDFAMLMLCTLAATWALSLVGLPLPFLIAPIMVSAALRLMGVVDGELPAWLVEGALIVTGASLGCRFKGADPKILLPMALWTIIGTAGMIAVAALFAWIAAPVVDVTFAAALLAFMPGGVAEMAIIALALNIDPSFVATHHVARIAFILAALPFLAALFRRRQRAEDTRTEDSKSPGAEA